MREKKTLIIGASTNPSRYSYLAADRLRQHGHPFVLVGRDTGEVFGEPIKQEVGNDTDIDTITLYINPTIQEQYYDTILGLKPKRIIFNPGTENTELERLAEKNGIEAIEACTLVMLGSGQY